MNQPNKVVLSVVFEEMKTLMSDIKKIQKKGITPTESRYISDGGFPTDFHKHLRFTRLSLEVLNEDISEVGLANMKLLAEEQDSRN